MQLVRRLWAWFHLGPDMLHACMTGDAETATRLLDAGVSPDMMFSKRDWQRLVKRRTAGSSHCWLEEGNRPLHTAAARGHTPLCELLVSRGADPNGLNREGRNALHATYTRYDTAMRLVELGTRPSIDEHCSRLLYLDISRKGSTRNLQTLIQAGMPVNECIDGRLPLCEAVTAGNLDAVKLLLSLGADPDAQDRKGRSALHCAVLTKGLAEVLDCVLERATKLDLQDEEGCTPLHLASFGAVHDVAVMELLLRGANSMVSNHDGWYPIEVMAEHGDNDDVMVLLALATDFEQAISLVSGLEDRNLDIRFWSLPRCRLEAAVLGKDQRVVTRLLEQLAAGAIPVAPDAADWVDDVRRQLTQVDELLDAVPAGSSNRAGMQACADLVRVSLAQHHARSALACLSCS